MSQPRLALSIGVPTGIKIFATVVATLMIAGSALAAVFAFGFSFFARTTVNSTVGDGEWHVDDNGNLVPGPAPDPGIADGITVIGFVGAACALAVALIAGYLMLRVWRTAAWLEGTQLTVRGALSSKSADLSTSIVNGGSQLQAVGAGEVRSYHRVQVLQVADPRSGVQLTLPLRGAGLAILPAAQLTALADAITQGRSRNEATESSFVVAERLRDFARDPFA